MNKEEIKKELRKYRWFKIKSGVYLWIYDRIGRFYK